MVTTGEQEEYLAEIRSHVCAQCLERPPGSPPCAPLGKVCGVEAHLAELIDALHDVRSVAVTPYREAVKREICAHCPHRHSSACPCPMDCLLALIVEAVEAVDARLEWKRKGLRRLASLAESSDSSVETIREIYDEAAGSWTGCDWPTKHGELALDLNGWTAAGAARKAPASRGAEASAWHAASAWLAALEQQAETAEEHAAWAVRAVAAGAWPEALDFARRAWATELATGRVLWRGFPATWQRLFLAIEAAMPEHSGTLDEAATSR